MPFTRHRHAKERSETLSQDWLAFLLLCAELFRRPALEQLRTRRVDAHVNAGRDDIHENAAALRNHPVAHAARDVHVEPLPGDVQRTVGTHGQRGKDAARTLRLPQHDARQQHPDLRGWLQRRYRT